eukprot:3566406-Amphidinium_carterae.1
MVEGQQQQPTCPASRFPSSGSAKLRWDMQCRRGVPWVASYDHPSLCVELKTPPKKTLKVASDPSKPSAVTSLCSAE